MLLHEDSWLALSGNWECGTSVLFVVELGAYKSIVEARRHVPNMTFQMIFNLLKDVNGMTFIFGKSVSHSMRENSTLNLLHKQEDSKGW